MFASERQKKVKSILSEYKKVDVSNLSNILSVSEVTVRKDLEQLEKEGFLIRTYGGAVLNEANFPSDYHHYYSENKAELEHKKSIGLIVPHMIANGDLIYLGPGLTCVEIAKNLKNKQNLTIITNNVSAATELADNPELRVVTTGGDLIKRNGIFTLTGTSVESFFLDKYLDKIIISVDAVKFTSGFCVQNEALARVYRQVIEHSDEKIFVATSSKFNKNALCRIGDLLIADKVVSDESIPDEYVKYFFDQNIQVFSSYDIQDI